MLPFGLKAADKLVDDHFHKIPNHFFHPNTYSVKKSKRQHAKERVKEHERRHEERSQDRGDDSDNGIDSDPDDEFPDVPRHSGAPQSTYDPQYTASPIHSQEPLQLRREYVPSSAGSNADSAPPRRQYDIPPPPPVSSREPPPTRRYYDPPPQNSEPPRNQLDTVPPPKNRYYDPPQDSESSRNQLETLPPPPRSPPRNRAPSMDSPKRYSYPSIPKSQFVPPPPPIGSPNPRQSRRQSRDYPPSVQAPPQRRQRGRSLHDRDRDSEYSSSTRPSRPKIVTRRSSSYHYSPRSKHDYGYVTANDRIQQHREVKSEKKELFTDSPTGLAGGAVGALVGGLAAREAQRDRKGDPDTVLTLLGAAVGGLAVNAVVGKGEDRRQVEERVLHGEKREHRRSRGSNGSVKYRDRGYGSEDDGGEVSRSGSGRSRRRRSQRESRGYGSDGYD